MAEPVNQPVSERVHEYGGRRLTDAEMAAIDEQANRRPAPLARSGPEIQATLRAVAELAYCGDRRCEALAKGAYFAARWVSGESAYAPASTRTLPVPNFREVAFEIETAGRCAAGAQVFPNSSWCDEGRIAARGVEEWLAWAFMPAYPTPVWLVAGAPLDDVRWVLGDVGLDKPGWPGLRGQFPSNGLFAYDVADFIDCG